MYNRRPVPEKTEGLASWLEVELRRIEQEFRGVGTIQLSQLNVEPSRPRDGMIVLADGTNWDPGSGEGFYGYYNATWNKLG